MVSGYPTRAAASLDDNIHRASSRRQRVRACVRSLVDGRHSVRRRKAAAKGHRRIIGATNAWTREFAFAGFGMGILPGAGFRLIATAETDIAVDDRNRHAPPA